MDGRRLVIAGGGNAGLCAAIAAIESGSEVTVVESASRFYRGGNSKYTRDIRYAHAKSKYASGVYSKEELLSDLESVSGGKVNREMAKLVIAHSEEIPAWMEAHGIIFKNEIRGTLNLSRTNAFFLGGGKALVNTYYDYLSRKGAKILYETRAVGISLKDGEFAALKAIRNGRRTLIKGDALVVASGGFEANLAWLRKYWGSKTKNFIIRGSKENTGTMLRELIRLGAATAGEETGMHAIAVDSRSPQFDGGIVTRIDSIPIGVVVNKKAKRFYDEGEDIWPKRYAIWGHLIARQPGQIAYSIFDSTMTGGFLPPIYPPYSADTIEGLASKLGLDADALNLTIEAYNRASIPYAGKPKSDFDLHTNRILPAKSHWALPISKSPFYAIPLKPGITFTYMGVKIDRECHVLKANGKRFESIFAAGEIASGNILESGYLAGFGLTIGTATGRIAGKVSSNG
ncbi:FAD-dependent tricarballylate dehydrogenase TcuA [Candidatus Marsarchaeota archaeon]|nr:FAD-dependent tricarballylate dehydrogenase TcuA [Candidatus Marsarchaeota archaeon]